MNWRKLVLATRNRGKLREIRALLAGLPLTVVSIDDLPAPLPEIIEDQPTFAGNAIKKAEAVARLSGEMALADDSGLEVEALGGRPGVHSAHFAGPARDDRANNLLLLEMLKGIAAPQRGAVFRCVMALSIPGNKTCTVEGTCPGRISGELRGQGGFGYDPLFIFEPSGLSFAEMAPHQKNMVSHRARAMREMRLLIERLFKEVARGE